MFRVVCLAFLCAFLFGCATSKPDVSVEACAKEGVSVMERDSLRAKFVLTLAGENGKNQEFDAVLFSVPGKRYRLELTGPMGIGVASLLWQESGWLMVFPTEKMYAKGVGEMVGILNEPALPVVPIHQVASIFEGVLVPESFEKVSEADSAGHRVILGKARNGMVFSYGEENGHVAWLNRIGQDGSRETLKFSDFRTFENVDTPERILFERDGKFLLSIKIKKVTRKKPFSSGTWRLNLPKSYKLVGE